jgi:hypothetical protein
MMADDSRCHDARLRHGMSSGGRHSQLGRSATAAVAEQLVDAIYSRCGNVCCTLCCLRFSPTLTVRVAYRPLIASLRLYGTRGQLMR